jgi:hypothetical protein
MSLLDENHELNKSIEKNSRISLRRTLTQIAETNFFEEPSQSKSGFMPLLFVRERYMPEFNLDLKENDTSMDETELIASDLRNIYVD